LSWRRWHSAASFNLFLAGAELALSVVGQSGSNRVDGGKNRYNSAPTDLSTGPKGETRTTPQHRKQKPTKSPEKVRRQGEKHVPVMGSKLPLINATGNS